MDIQAKLEADFVGMSVPVRRHVVIARAHAGALAKCFRRAINCTCQWFYTICYHTCKKHFLKI